MRRRMIGLLSLLLAVTQPVAAGRAAERVATAIVFAVDVSGSVNAERYELQRAGIAGIFADERIEPFLADGLAVAIMEWSDGHEVVVPWTILRSTADARRLAARVAETTRSPGFSTELSLALLSTSYLLVAYTYQKATQFIYLWVGISNNAPITTPP